MIRDHITSLLPVPDKILEFLFPTDLQTLSEPSIGMMPTAPSGGGPRLPGFRPPPGTRVISDGIPDNWRITNSRGPGGVRSIDPANTMHKCDARPGA
jgi:hypothetical protein